MTNNIVLTAAFNLIPGLVVDLMGQPAIVTANDRSDTDAEITKVTVNMASGDVVDLPLDYNAQVRVLGIAVDCAPDNIDLFDN